MSPRACPAIGGLFAIPWFYVAPADAADPLCDGSYHVFSDDHTPPVVTWVGIGDAPRMVLEVEVEGPTVTSGSQCWALARVIASYQGAVDSGYVWVDALCGHQAVVAGARLVVPAVPTRGDAVHPSPPASVVALGRSPADASFLAYEVGPEHVVYFGEHEPLRLPRLLTCLSIRAGAFRCPLADWDGASAPWYGMGRETLRQWAWNGGAGRDGARIPGATPPGGVPARVDAIAGGVWPSWAFAADVYDDVVRVQLTHGETVDPLGHDGCRAFGSILSVSRGPRAAGERVALRVPLAQCLFVSDLDAPVTWVAILEPTEDPRSDAAVVELLPLEPRVWWASSDYAQRWWDPLSDVFHLERPDCPNAARQDTYDAKWALLAHVDHRIVRPMPARAPSKRCHEAVVFVGGGRRVVLVDDDGIECK